MADNPILRVAPLASSLWQTRDPFLVCAHHLDLYPPGNEQLGPSASLAGRNLGNDFAGQNGWRMYHGDVVPGFPQHPHRGFETVTLVRDGYIDHSDSLGATARFGAGDTQWLTAGEGIAHAEMFPLLDRTRPNRLELFQIWLNLPARSKLAQPYFTMLWSETIPRHAIADDAGRQVVVTTVAGALNGRQPPAPPPDSWAADESSDLAIWSIVLEAGASWTLPAARSGETARTLYFFSGDELAVADRTISEPSAIEVEADRPILLRAPQGPAEVLLLQGRPIGEPVEQYGPFVMNTRAELQAAFAEYRRTQFGGWPFPADAPVHPRDAGRFARHADGRMEQAPA